MEEIRSFAIVKIDDFDVELERFTLDYADSPKNLGFEMQFTTLETRLTTYFTSAREKKIATTLNVNFLPPNAYSKLNAFKSFIQRNMNSRLVFEYKDTTGVKLWEGKVQKLGQEELLDWQGLTCPIAFLPGTPKFIKKDNAILIRYSSVGKNYPYKYPYSYGATRVENNEINNDYFDEIPLRVTIFGGISNPVLYLTDTATGDVYSTVRFDNLFLSSDEHLIIDSIQSKILLWRGGKYQSAYDYLNKSEEYDSFLFAKQDTKSRLDSNLSASDSGYIRASYRQYTL